MSKIFTKFRILINYKIANRDLAKIKNIIRYWINNKILLYYFSRLIRLVFRFFMLRSFGQLNKEHDVRIWNTLSNCITHYAKYSVRLRAATNETILNASLVTRLSTIRSERIMARKRLFAARCSSVTPSISQRARRRVGGICFRARPVIPTLMRGVARLTSPLYQQLDVKIVARVSVVEPTGKLAPSWLIARRWQ